MREDTEPLLSGLEGYERRIKEREGDLVLGELAVNELHIALY